MPLKLLIADVETTGIEHWRNSIHQISAMVVIDDQIIDTINLHIRPHELSQIDEHALKVSGVTKEQVMAYPHRTIQFGLFRDFLNKYIDTYKSEDRFFLVGFRNAAFDDEFIRRAMSFEGLEFGSYFFNNTIDISSLASHYLAPVRASMPSFKLSRVAKYLGIEVKDADLHNSLYDVELTFEIYKKVRGGTIADW